MYDVTCVKLIVDQEDLQDQILLCETIMHVGRCCRNSVFWVVSIMGVFCTPGADDTHISISSVDSYYVAHLDMMHGDQMCLESLYLCVVPMPYVGLQIVHCDPRKQTR